MRRVIAFAVGITILVTLGCRPRPVPKADDTYDRLSWISEAYRNATDENGRAPARIEDLAPYLKQRGEIAEIVRSANDGQDFTIFWNVDYRTYENESKPYPVIAYETVGAKGMRYVLQVRHVSQVTNEQLKQLAFPPGEKGPS